MAKTTRINTMHNHAGKDYNNITSMIDKLHKSSWSIAYIKKTKDFKEMKKNSLSHFT